MMTKEKLEEFERFLEKSMFLSKSDSEEFGISRICDMKLHKKIKNETNYFEFDNLLDAIYSFHELTDTKTAKDMENSLRHQANILNIGDNSRIFLEIICYDPFLKKDMM